MYWIFVHQQSVEFTATLANLIRLFGDILRGSIRAIGHVFAELLFFETEKIDSPALIAGHHHCVVHECTATSATLKSESCQRLAALQVPNLQRIVRRSGDRAPPIRGER